MAQKKKRNKTKQLRPMLERNQETPAADVMTTAWMLCLLTGVVCEVGAALLRFFAHEEQPSLAMLSGLLFFASLAIGLFSLALLPIVLKSRQTPPPKPLVVGGVVIALLPWIVLAVLLISG